MTNGDRRIPEIGVTSVGIFGEALGDPLFIIQFGAISFLRLYSSAKADFFQEIDLIADFYVVGEEDQDSQ